MMPESNGPVLVTGARGMIGRAVVERLLADGQPVRALAHRGRARAFLEHPLLEVVTGDVRNTESMRNVAADCRGIVHCAAAKNDERDSHAVNVLGTQNVVIAAQRAGCEFIVHLSTQSVRLERRGTYGETKRRAEEVVRSGAVPAVILRPSVVYRDFESGILGSVARYLRLPRVPVIGTGTAVYQPIFVGDLAAIVAESVVGGAGLGGTYDIGGPTPVDFLELALQVAERLDRQPRFFHLPPWFALAIARVGAAVGIRPITRSNVLGAIQSCPMDLGPMNRDFETVARTLPEGLDRAFDACPQQPARARSRIATHA